MQKHGNLYDFLTTILENKSLDNVRLLQISFLDDLMNGFSIYKTIKGENNAADLYLYLLGNPRRTIYDIFLNALADKYNKEIYLQAQKLVILREYILKKLTNKGILNNNSDKSNIVEQKYEESIAKKTKFEESIAGGIKLRKQRFKEIAKREKMINNNLFKEYFEYSSPSDMYKNLDAITNIEKTKLK